MPGKVEAFSRFTIDDSQSFISIYITFINNTFKVFCKSLRNN